LNFSIKGISSFCLRRVVESAAWVAQVTSLRAESRHGPELFLRYLDAAWADCVVSVYPELRFFMASSQPGASMKNDYKVGYKKPPKEHQFKSKHLRDEAPGARTQRVEKGLDVAAWIDKPLKVKRRGKSTTMHPHEASLISLGNRALKGEPRATRLFLKECEIAGLLEPAAVGQTHGVVVIQGA